jgi:hypothetical protein
MLPVVTSLKGTCRGRQGWLTEVYVWISVVIQWSGGSFEDAVGNRQLGRADEMWVLLRDCDKRAGSQGELESRAGGGFTAAGMRKDDG